MYLRRSADRSACGLVSASRGDLPRHPRYRQAGRRRRASDMSSEELIKLAAIKGFRSVVVEDGPESELAAARPSALASRQTRRHTCLRPP
jgi:hypothetical protein